jgi:thiol:disulfide interchange protein DsbA
MPFTRGLVIAALALLAPAASAAQGYRTLDVAAPANDADSVQVTEFFWYGCPHCYRFEPYVERWLKDKPADVEFRRMPAALSPEWALHGRAFYAAQVLGVLDQFHQAMFKAMHEQGQRMRSAEAIGEFAASLGLDGDAFVDTMNSFAVDSRMRRAKQLQKDYGVSGTPAVVIDGRYLTSGSMAGNFERMMDIIDARVAAVRRDGG